MDIPPDCVLRLLCCFAPVSFVYDLIPDFCFSSLSRFLSFVRCRDFSFSDIVVHVFGFGSLFLPAGFGQQRDGMMCSLCVFTCACVYISVSQGTQWHFYTRAGSLQPLWRSNVYIFFLLSKASVQQRGWRLHANLSFFLPLSR